MRKTRFNRIKKRNAQLISRERNYSKHSGDEEEPATKCRLLVPNSEEDVGRKRVAVTDTITHSFIANHSKDNCCIHSTTDKLQAHVLSMAGYFTGVILEAINIGSLLHT